MYFEIIGEITDVEVIARGSGIRDLARLNEKYGNGNWRKLKGNATVQLGNGCLRFVELHCYEAHGIGRRLTKIKCYLDES